MNNENKRDEDNQARPLARQSARELTPAEIETIAGGRPKNTNATGPNGDDPADPGTYL